MKTAVQKIQDIKRRLSNGFFEKPINNESVKKESIDIEIYRIGMPKKGWIHHCYSCSMQTAKTMVYKTIKLDGKKYVFNVYLCGGCRKYFKCNTEKYLKFNRKINRYIHYNYDYLLPS
jgi:MinD superfamily P-loop ATPase